MNSSNEPILPLADVLNDFSQGKFVLSNLAAKRAKQLKEGAPPLVRVDSHHPITIALAEIAAGKIRPMVGQVTAESAIIDSDMDTDVLPTDLGILLPALEDAEPGLGLGLLDGDLHDEDEIDHDEAAPSLTDLLGDTELEAPAADTEGDEETLSLTDLGDQEESAAADEDGDND